MMRSLSIKCNINEITQWSIVSAIILPLYAEFFVLLIINLILLIHYRYFIISKAIAIGLSSLFLHAVISITIIGYTFEKFTQQFILVGIFIILYYNYISFNKKQIINIFDKYLQISFIVSIIGSIQFILYFFLGINILHSLYGLTAEEIPRILRVQSIAAEPSYLSTFLTPALFFYLLGGKRIKGCLLQKYIIYAIVVLTFSTVTYTIIGIFVIYKYLIYSKKSFIRIATFFSIAIMIVSMFTIMSSRETIFSSHSKDNAFGGIIMRWNDSFTAFKKLDPKIFENLNLSSYASLSNFWVALNAPNRISGTGLGTHQQNYLSTYFSKSPLYGWNSTDGYSMANRLFSEFGIIGLILIILFLFKFYNKKSKINIAILFVLLTYLIRGGHYVLYGTMFFIILYYYSSLAPSSNTKTPN